MARDAIARLYDVEKNLVKLEPGPVKESYQAGTIAFQAKKGKSVDLNKFRESIAATRLSGGTRMGMDYLEITARGEVVVSGKEVLLKVAGTGEEFVLTEEAGKKALERLRAAGKAGGQVTVTGHVQGWNGRFPDVLKAQAQKAKSKARPVLLVKDLAGAGD
jgi:hypothetical protein